MENWGLRVIIEAKVLFLLFRVVNNYQLSTVNYQLPSRTAPPRQSHSVVTRGWFSVFYGLT